MDEIKRLYVGNIVSLENTVIDLTNGVVLKTIIVSNPTGNPEEFIVNIDGGEFIFKVEPKTTFIMDKPIVCNILKVKASTQGEIELPIHISGIQLGGA